MKKFGMMLVVTLSLAFAGCGDDDEGVGKKMDVSKGRNDCEKQAILNYNGLIDYCEKNKSSCKQCDCLLQGKSLEGGQCVTPKADDKNVNPVPNTEPKCEGEAREAASNCLKNQTQCESCGGISGKIMCGGGMPDWTNPDELEELAKCDFTS